MQKPALSPNEPVRLQALSLTGLLDTPTEERFDRITRLTRRALNVPIVALSLVDTGRQWFKSIQGLDVCETSRDISFCGHTILSDELLIVPNAAEDPRFHDNPLVKGDPHIVFYAGCPVRTPDGNRVGTLCVIDHKERDFCDDDITTLRDLGMMVEREIGIAFQDSVQAELLAQLTSAEREAMVDPLTRLWNRDGLDTKFRSMLAGCPGRQQAFALMMIDIDQFKHFNDEYGHPVGDEILQEVSRRLTNVLRDGDVVGRYGGDEFMVTLNRVNTAGAAMEIAQRVRERIAEEPIVVESYPIHTTISIGVAFAADTIGIGADQMIQVADNALYESKAAGRNAVKLTMVDKETSEDDGLTTAA